MWNSRESPTPKTSISKTNFEQSLSFSHSFALWFCVIGKVLVLLCVQRGTVANALILVRINCITCITHCSFFPTLYFRARLCSCMYIVYGFNPPTTQHPNINIWHMTNLLLCSDFNIHILIASSWNTSHERNFPSFIFIYLILIP